MAGFDTVGVQTPARQRSPLVHIRPSSQVVPSGATPLEQVPVVGLQVPAIWQAPVAGGQTMATPGTQAPAWQTSPLVQALLSEQVVPFGAAGFEQVPLAGSQTPATWHVSDAAQTLGALPVQAPAWQVSVWVQALPSLQVVPLGADGFEQAPVVLLQVPGV